MRIKRKINLPLNERNISEYIKSQYPGFSITGVNTVLIDNFIPLRQGYFKDKLNCSVTSMTAAINHYTGNSKDANDIYAYVRKIAKCFLYTPSLFGTLSFTIGPIYSICLKHFKVSKKTGYRLIKGIGFRKKKLINLINSDVPVILSMFRDGRHCYGNHTVTVIGYRTYFYKNKELLFLVLNDNWSDETRFLDYNKLWRISAINY